MLVPICSGGTNFPGRVTVIWDGKWIWSSAQSAVGRVTRALPKRSNKTAMASKD